MLQHVESRSS